MFTCLAFATLAAASLGEIPALAAEVEGDARALVSQTEISERFYADLTDFSSDAMALSTALRSAGVTQDLPCIFRGISEDALERAEAFRTTDDAEARRIAFADLRALLDDAILLAPMATAAVQDETE